MQDAPEDLYAEARRQLLDPQKYSPEEIARREQLLEQTIADLRAPLHPNCYLSPTQFAEKFGLPPPATAEPAAEPVSIGLHPTSDPSPASTANQGAPHWRRPWALWLSLTWALAATAVAALSAIGAVWR